jgi:NADH dehydrogenase
VELENGEILNFDVLIWTVGIAGVALPAGLEVPLDKQQRILTDSYLRVQGKHEIFVIGDLAKIIYSAGEVPASAQDAIHQAQYLSRALISFSKNQLPAVYKPKKPWVYFSHG